MLLNKKINQISVISTMIIALGVMISCMYDAPRDNPFDGGVKQYVWTERTSAGKRIWRAAASNADGTILFASENAAYMWRSIDGGVNWVQATTSPAGYWCSIASSATGADVVASNPDNTGRIIIASSDSGDNWATRAGSNGKNWTAVASSSSGKYLVAGDNGNGATGCILYFARLWCNLECKRFTTRLVTDVASSPDGTKLAASVSNDYIYTSTNSGETWTAKTGSGKHLWYGLAISLDGKKIAATCQDPNIYISTDSGSTWTTIIVPEAIRIYGLACSSDFTIMVAPDCGLIDHSGSYIFTSQDGGLHWKKETAAGKREWSFITKCSSDGTKIVAADASGLANYIWTGELK